MPRPKLVKLNGVELTEALSVTVMVETPTEVRGAYSGLTTAPTIAITRKATNAPKIDGFKFATNEDGRLGIVNVVVDLENAKREQTYHIESNKAYVVDWRITDTNNHRADAMEEIVLKCGELKINAKDGGATFTLESFPT